MKVAVKFASHLPSESSDGDDVGKGLPSRVREVMASESSDVSSLTTSESEDSLDLTKFSATSGTIALTGPDLPPASSDSDCVGDRVAGWKVAAFRRTTQTVSFPAAGARANMLDRGLG